MCGQWSLVAAQPDGKLHFDFDDTINSLSTFVVWCLRGLYKAMCHTINLSYKAIFATVEINR